MQRQRIHIEGIVQGVGFRPFVYRMARRSGLAGWVLNDSRGVIIEAEGDEARLDDFLRALREEIPPLASISRFETVRIPPAGEGSFVIRASEAEREKRAQIAPDTWVCEDCLRELFDPADRRFRYPFLNCTNCGPRYTIVTGIPYDRTNTTMADFPMCSACREEYEDPASRRFHAQPNACPECGPRLSLHDAAGRIVAEADPAAAAVDLLRRGAILAVKGLGGYHLAADAAHHEAVAELRRRKRRDEKPFALMSARLEEIEGYAFVDETERRLLEGPERPIVLLRQRADHGLSPLVAPRNRYFGVLLPYAPLHYLLLRDHFRALIMTSGNLSDEPIAYEDADAGERLEGIADFFLRHDRRIHIRTDDSIARVLGGRPLVLRRSRGYVPRAIRLPAPQPPVLALGGELKNAFCLTRGEQAFLGHHVGDLKNPEVFDSFRHSLEHLQGILELRPSILAHDLHPDYLSTRFAEEQEGVERVAVQHHHAHLASCLAENGVSEPALGVIFDGVGYGEDGRLWGGEFLVGDFTGYRRAGHFAYVPMPGGDAATREPFRMALSYLFQAYGEDLPALPPVAATPAAERRLLRQMVQREINSPLTSSCGRLFDAVAALCGLRQRVSYEGQAALELEMAIAGSGEVPPYPFVVREEGGVLLFDPVPLVREIAEELLQGGAAARVSARFHQTLAAMVLEVCTRLRAATGLERVALSGGVFQNRRLSEATVQKLEAAGFRVLTHSLVPPNDGGLALGQAAIAGAGRPSQAPPTTA